MLLTVYGTEWSNLCWCAIKKLLTHWLTRLSLNIVSRSAVRTSVHKSLSDSDEIWYIGRGQWMSVKVTRPSTLGLQFLSTPPLTTGTDKWLAILKLRVNISICSSLIFDIWPSFCVTQLWISLAHNNADPVRRSQQPRRKWSSVSLCIC